MASAKIAKDQILFSAGEPITELYLIAQGSFVVSFPGGEYILSKGEAPGICELTADLHIMTCRALEDSSVLVYPVSDITSLEALFKEIAEYCMVFTRSAFRQMNSLLQKLELEQFNCNSLYTDCVQDYESYQSYCNKNQLHIRSLSSFHDLVPYGEPSPEDPWAPAYYDGFQRLLTSQSAAFLAKEPSVLSGLIAGICRDVDRILPAISGLTGYQKQTLSLYINDNVDDLFDRYGALYVKLGNSSEDSEEVYAVLTRMTQQLEASPHIDKQMVSQRISDFMDSIASMAPAEKAESSIDSTSIGEKLNGSLQTILDYSCAEQETCSAFKKLMTQYKKLPDQNATDDVSRNLRQKLTQLFYELYSLVFTQASQDRAIPLPIRMFLYFGYMDEQLAGMENAAILADMAERISKRSHERVYTLYDWLLAILNGKKEPSRNEFDQDYTDFIHSQRVSGKITASEEERLARDTQRKVEYELTNMFPTVNKVAFGRISTFCPIFSANNILKSLDSSYVSAEALEEALQVVEDVDYTAFYREYVYTNTDAGIPKEYFHMRILPDFILMPGSGTRGVMWQEIEGRRRTTPSRMMLPIFYLEDLNTAIVRLVGEYRWEMCKRIQGARWNDVSERSLTSEYFDYIQFYRKNHELSADTKERLKNALQKARGSFKEMFVRDYITYVLFEGTGSPRLTKPARGILFTYCPFSAKTRKVLGSNPIYKDMMELYEMRKGQHLHKLDILSRRIENSGNELPEELTDELAYLNG